MFIDIKNILNTLRTILLMITALTFAGGCSANEWRQLINNIEYQCITIDGYDACIFDRIWVLNDIDERGSHFLVNGKGLRSNPLWILYLNPYDNKIKANMLLVEYQCNPIKVRILGSNHYKDIYRKYKISQDREVTLWSKISKKTPIYRYIDAMCHIK